VSSLINPSHYESEDGVFNLPLFLYDSLRDIMKSEFDQIRSVISNDDEADRVVRLIKGRYQAWWQQTAMALFRLGLIEPCVCKPKEKCDRCSGAQWIMVRGIDYRALADHADLVLRDALTRRMQSQEHKELLEAVKKANEQSGSTEDEL
jgi:ABC-type phosphate/phosphonate transport system ATPase subunit